MSRAFEIIRDVDLPAAPDDVWVAITRDAAAWQFPTGMEIPAGEQPPVLLATQRLADRLLSRLGLGGRHRAPPAAAACCTDLTMFWYPVQRHRFPSRPSRISASLGSGFSFSRSTAAMTMPGVQ